MSVTMCNCEPQSQITRERRRCCWKMVFNTSFSPARSSPLTLTLQSLTPLFVHLHHSACKVSAPISLLISSDKSHDLNSSLQIWWLQNWFGCMKKKRKKKSQHHRRGLVLQREEIFLLRKKNDRISRDKDSGSQGNYDSCPSGEEEEVRVQHCYRATGRRMRWMDGYKKSKILTQRLLFVFVYDSKSVLVSDGWNQT